jgi:uncharacterized protein YfbU (UPF0304 family)
MKLSKLERAMVINQLEIRKALTPTARDFDQAIEILHSGYEIFYDEAIGHLFQPMSEDASNVVFEVLEMYRAIERFHDANPGDNAVAELHDAHFRGFDGNNEVTYMAFTRFLIKVQGKYQEQLKYEKDTDGFNSHWPMLSTYLEYLSRWKELGDARFKLTREQVIAILSEK